MKWRSALVAALVLSTSCGGGDGPAPEPELSGGAGSQTTVTGPVENEPNDGTTSAPPSTDGPPSSEPSVDTSNGIGTTVELLDSGAEPRRQLRIRPEVGATQRVTTLMDMKQVIGMPGDMFDNTMPVFEMDQVNTITSIDDGEIRVEQVPYEFRIVDDRGLSPAVLTEIERSLDLMLDLGSITFTVNDRSQVTDQTVMGEAAMYDLGGLDSASMASDISVPLPAEAIGIGARWRVTSQTMSGGMRTDAVTELELVELDDTQAVATHVQMLTMPQGFIEGSFDRDEVLEGSHNSTGTITWHFDHALPILSQSGSGTIRMRSFRGGTSTTLTIDQELAITMTVKN